MPGVFEPYPVYAPALVAFLGGAGAGLYVSGAYAAVMTLRHKGSIMLAEPGALPRSSRTAAILRY